MRNYVINGIGKLKYEYPNLKDHPEIAARLLPMDEYLKVARILMKRVGPTIKMSPEDIAYMMSSEDAVSEVATRMMLGDWRYTEELSNGKDLYNYRYQTGMYAIRNYWKKMQFQKNEMYSLDYTVGGDEDSVSLHDEVEDHMMVMPEKAFNNADRKARVSKYINFIMKQTDLSPAQKKCLHLKYVEGIDCNAEIGRKLDPPVSRQCVQQTLANALEKLKQTAKGVK